MNQKKRFVNLQLNPGNLGLFFSVPLQVHFVE